MAHLRRMFFLSHLRADPNQYILHYRRGKLVRSGISLAYWFNPLSAAIAQVPAEDVETTFVMQERTADLQQVAVQCTLIYRCVDPQRLAGRVNFTIGLKSGAWVEEPLERLNSLWSQKARPPARSYLATVPVDEAMRRGADHMSQSIAETLRADPEIEELGLSCVSVQILKVAPGGELEKALQTPTREAIQQKADEASFQRRALAVEKERAIKENELATEIELARRQEQLIEQEGANQLRTIEHQASTERASVEAEVERQRLSAQGQAERTRLTAEAEAEAHRVLAEAENRAERERVGIWTEAPTRVHTGLALQELAKNLPKIEHLNLTPDLVGESLQRWLRGLGEGSTGS